MPKRRKPPRVECVWIDARDLFDEFTLDEAAQQTLVERHTSGYLVYRDDEKTIIAHDWDPPDSVGNVTVLPSGWVRLMRGPKTRKKRGAPPSESAPS